MKTFDASTNTALIRAQDNSIEVVPNAHGPPPRVVGYTIGVAEMAAAPPHGGEMHPDGDELLILISGNLRLLLDGRTPVDIAPGDAFVVPKGEWHRVEILSLVRLVFVTPGPNAEFR